MLVMICYDVLMRYAFNAPTSWANELSGYTLAGVVFLGLAYAQGKGAHVRIDLFTARLPEGVRALLGRATGWILVWFVAVFLWQAVVLVINNHGYGTRSYGPLNTPIWMPQTIMSAGLGLLLVTILSGLALAEPQTRRGRIIAGLVLVTDVFSPKVPFENSPVLRV